MRAAVRDLLINACAAPPARRPFTPRLDDWREAIAAADQAGLAGPLFAHAGELPAAERAPAGLLDSLRTLYYAQAAQNADLLTTLAEILQALATEGIPTVVLKGAALLETVYENVALRSMRDLDLLFRREDLDRAVGVMERIGFSRDEWFQPGEWYVENLHHLVPYRRGGITVELHHHVVPPWIPLAVSPAELWERSVPVPIAGQNTRVLSPDDSLLHMAVHVSAAHGFVNGLNGLRDLAAMQERLGDAIDWRRLALSARGQERAVWAALDVTHRLLGGRPPSDSPLSGLERRALTALARRVVLRSRARDPDLVPTWWLQIGVTEMLAPRGWVARSGAMLVKTVSMMTRRPKGRP